MAGPDPTDSSNGTRARKVGVEESVTREDLLAKEDKHAHPTVREVKRRIRHFGPTW